MKNQYILKQTDKSVFGNPIVPKPSKYTLRPTVKAILRKGDKFGFVKSEKSGLIYLPGGGAESPNLEREIVRECLEETGYIVRPIAMFAVDHSLRNGDGGREIITTTFEVEVIGKSKEDLREPDEMDVNLHTIFLSPADTLEILQNQNAASLDGLYNHLYNAVFTTQRDYVVFSEYLKQRAS